jgi:MoxR-like ATPase
LSAAAASAAGRLVDAIASVVLGKREVVTRVVVGLVAGGHVLLEDVPGTGKTTLARALARATGGEFRRVQCTADLLPADVIGVSVWSATSESFRFQPGPVFANVVLADELNRTTPRTQSSLLEAMSEGRVSVDGVTTALPRPFMVIATQNPVAFEGTYPLPESQLDRFLLRLELGYPDREHERELLAAGTPPDPVAELEPVLGGDEILGLIEQARQVEVAEELVEYALDLVEATRRSRHLALGASTRGALALAAAARAMALVAGRDYCVPDDLKELALPTLAHRLVAADDQEDTREILSEIIAAVPVPG